MVSRLTQVLKLHSPKIHFWRDQLDSIFPAVRSLVALPHHDGRVAAMAGQVGERHALLQFERLRHHHHAPIGVDDARMRFHALALPAAVVPFQPHRDARVHPVPTPLLMVPRTDSLGFMQLYGHFRLYYAMLELRAKTVNGTNSGGRANE